MKQKQINIFLVGDSTMAEYDATRSPQTGWGQALHQYVTSQVEIWNEAFPGRSSKSFFMENRLERVENNICTGDYLLIQFGHNDEKADPERHTDPFTSFQAYLKRYIATARNNQAHAVLITPVQRRSYDLSGNFQETHGDYPAAIKQLGARLKVPVVDLAAESRKLLEKLGPQLAKQLYLWLERGEEINYPDGLKDDTHFCQYGANMIAQLVVNELKTLNLPLTGYLKA
ncbi:Lysophospholipase L1 [Evansella caseinilytica]|uniref:Lysophospholipase L1 n=1 Tax=Evansella caseinilytica TaxID=1503961 RepID=A0A1H3NWP0_9BACI|nr:rhamnogalacturonan acetylesterase [Evansella caseinilytica]SDY93306.1 Lysophospholipase L1 [Evansella caseinilytica]